MKAYSILNNNKVIYTARIFAKAANAH